MVRLSSSWPQAFKPRRGPTVETQARVQAAAQVEVSTCPGQRRTASQRGPDRHEGPSLWGREEDRSGCAPQVERTSACHIIG